MNASHRTHKWCCILSCFSIVHAAAVKDCNSVQYRRDLIDVHSSSCFAFAFPERFYGSRTACHLDICQHGGAWVCVHGMESRFEKWLHGPVK